MTSVVLSPQLLGWSVPERLPRAAARAVEMPVRPSEDSDWFFELMSEQAVPRHVALRPPPVGTAPRAFVWLMLAVPLLAPVQLVALGLLHVAVPGWWVLAELAAALAGLAFLDARSLAAQGVLGPPRWSVLVPPLYLRLRGRAARHPVAPLAWGLAATVGVVAAALLGPATGPVALRSTQVEGHLLQRVLDREVALDPGTASVSCPRFARAWLDRPITCTGRDATSRVSFLVTPLDRTGHVAWEVLPA